MITMDTVVYRRIRQDAEAEAFQRGFQAARAAAVRALRDTMQETARFGTFDPQYVESCASDRLDYYIKAPNATCTNLVHPAA